MEKILNRLLRFPWLTLAVILVISAGFFIVMRANTRMETDLDKYMPQKHSAFVYSNQAEEWFNIKDGIIIGIESKDGICNPRTIEKIKDLIPIPNRNVSLANCIFEGLHEIWVPSNRSNLCFFVFIENRGNSLLQSLNV